MSHALTDIWCEQGCRTVLADEVAWKLSPSQKLLAAQEGGPVPLSQFGVADTSVASADYEEGVPRLLRLEDECLPSIQSGYGDNGESVQEGDQILSDRATGPQDGIQTVHSD